MAPITPRGRLQNTSRVAGNCDCSTTKGSGPVSKELADRSGANSGNNQIAGNFAPTRQHRAAYPVFAFQAGDPFRFEQLNAARDVVAFKKFRYRGREQAIPDAIFSKDQSGLYVLLRKNGCHPPCR
jgi:hypothetical protein